MASLLTRAGQDRVIEALASHIERRYVFAEAARRVAGQLRDDGPRYAGGGRAALATELTALLRPHDGHFTVRWQASPAEVLAWEEPDAAANRRRNYGFRHVSILDRNIAHLDVTFFCDTDGHSQAAARARAATTAAIGFSANSDAVILDLRDTPGGWGSGANYLLGHLLPDGPVHLVSFIGRAAAPAEAWAPAVADHLDAPLYVLINDRTASAAECCAYTLQSLRRATIVGTRSAGAANPGERFAVGDGFSVFIPTQAPVDPRTGGNWEGTGVIPDQETAGDALRHATDLIAA